MPFSTSEDPKTLFTEQTYLAAVIVEAGCHGVLFAVTILCLHAVLNDGDKSVTRRWFNIGYACTLFVLSTLGNISNSATAVIAFVNNRDFPGGPNVYLTEHYNTPLSMTGFVAFMLTTLMEDGYLLYRCIVVFERDWRFCAVPCLMFLGTIVCSALFVAQLVRPGASIWSKIVMGVATPYWTLNVAFTLLLTILIIVEIARVRKQSSPQKEGRNLLKMVAIMLVESAAIYTILGVVYLALYTSGNPVQEVFLNIIGDVQCISPILIMYTVAKGNSFFSKPPCEQTYQPNLSTNPLPSCILCGSETSSGNSSQEMEMKAIPSDSSHVV